MASTNIYASTGTGRTVKQGDNWSNVINSSTSGSVSNRDRADAISKRTDGANFECTRGHFPFDTSSLGAGAVIISATLKLYCQNKTDELGNSTVYVVQSTQASASDVTTADYGRVGTSITSKSYAQVTLNAYNDFDITPSYINKTGNTMLAIREFYDYTGNTPGSDQKQNIFAFSGSNDSTNKPYLVIVTADAPTVTTAVASNITGTSALGSGNVISDGGSTITERGFCWSTTSNPTTSNSKVTASGTTGSYTATLSGLSPNTIYHYRAYAINSAGTSYGSDTVFTTLNNAARFYFM